VKGSLRSLLTASMITSKTLVAIGYKNIKYGAGEWSTNDKILDPNTTIDGYMNKLESLKEMKQQHFSPSRVGTIRASNFSRSIKTPAYSDARRIRTSRQRQLNNLHSRLTHVGKSISTPNIFSFKRQHRQIGTTGRNSWKKERAIKNRRSQSLKVKLKFNKAKQPRPLTFAEMENLEEAKRQRSINLLDLGDSLSVQVCSVNKSIRKVQFGFRARQKNGSEEEGDNDGSGRNSPTTHYVGNNLNTDGSKPADTQPSNSSTRPSTVQFNFSGIGQPFGSQHKSDEFGADRPKILCKKDLYMESLLAKQKILEERKLMQQKERARTVLETMDTVDIESNSDEDSAVQPAPAALELAISRIESGEAAANNDEVQRSVQNNPEPIATQSENRDVGVEVPIEDPPIEPERRCVSPSVEFKSLFNYDDVPVYKEDNESEEGLSVKLKITKSMESEESHQIHGVWPRQTGVGRPSRVNILASDEYNNPMQKRGPSLAMANEPWSPPSTAGGHSIRPFTPGTDLQEWFQ
jgi:hypothetical protein